MSGTRAIPEDEHPFPPERMQERGADNIDPADAEATPEDAADDEEQPETQGDEPLEADLGEDGQGDLAGGRARCPRRGRVRSGCRADRPAGRIAVSGVGDQGLRPAHAAPTAGRRRELAAEEEARSERRPHRPDEPPIEPAPEAARAQDRRAPDDTRRSQRKP
ncbi:hypothetical protein OED01_03000 [Microbacterium sp. M28]|uniref:hypothetical protein n=1 Tax=Microbacterium sp. M28 TaxID=2962064 RepID=UPI0021F41707|nr:hypothetical protein [Microbacterium sp. M28]UYO97700.1 hypothetical protein OED01_03000 [Microbacterium sp. M28]